MKCRVEKQCGGCQYLHLSQKEIENKKKQTVQSLIRKYHLSASVDGIHMAKQTTGYRNKVIVGFTKIKGNVRAGLYAEHSHRVIPTEHCPMHPDIINRLIGRIAELVQSMKIELYNERTGTGVLRHVLLRYAKQTNQILVVFVTGTSQFPSRKNLANTLRKEFPEIVGIVHSINPRQTSVVLEQEGKCIAGKPWITDVVCGKQMVFSASSFFQVHHDQCEVLYGLAKKMLKPKKDEVLLDTYCGVGSIGLTMADSYGQVIGVERNKQAINNARTNKKLNQVSNIDFVCADSTEFMKQAAQEKAAIDALILDPPRAGTTKEFIQAAFACQPKKICYISCDPHTLARDLSLFSKQYKIQRLEIVDMFPYTKHIETVVKLSQ